MFILKFQGRSLIKASESELGLISRNVTDLSYENVRKFLRKEKLNHLYQNIYSVIEAIKPGSRQKYTESELEEIKLAFDRLGFEGEDQKSKHKNDYIWSKVREELSFPTLEN